MARRFSRTQTAQAERSRFAEQFNTQMNNRTFNAPVLRQNGAVSYEDPLVFLKIDPNNQAAIEELNSLKYHTYNADLGLHEVSRNEFIQFPHLAEECEVSERTETLEEYEKRMFGNTLKQAQEIADRVYLDFVPHDCFSWVNSKYSNVKFDTSKKKYYLSSLDALASSNVRFVQRCSSHRLINAYDFVKYRGDTVTPGMQMLADAFNMDDKVDRNKAIADAMFTLAKESVNNVPGAIKNTRNLLRIRELARKGVNDVDDVTFSRMFWDAKEQLLNSKKAAAKMVEDLQVYEKDPTKVVPPHLKEIYETYTANKEGESAHLESAIMAETEVRVQAHLHELTGEQFKKGLERRLNYALNNPNPDLRLKLARNVLLDYAKGHALCSEAYMIRSDMQRFLHNKEQLNEIIERSLKSSKLDPNDPQDQELSDMVRNLARITTKGCEHADCACITGINAKRDISAADFHASQEIIKGCPSMVNAYMDRLNPALSDDLQKQSNFEKIADFDQAKEPLYLRIDKNDLKNMPDDLKSDLRMDTVTASLCVEDTEQNRKKFLNYLPEYVEQMKFDKSYDELRTKAFNLLQENGYNMTLGDVKVNQGWKTDPKDHSKRYLINLQDGFPILQMYDFNGTLNKRVILSQPTEEERQQLKENAYKRALNDNVLQRQNQNERAKEIRDLVGELASKQSAMPEKHSYFDKKGLNVSDMQGMLYDKDGSIATKMMQFQGLSQKFLQDSIIAPLTNSAGKIVSAQIITGEPKKLNVKGAPMNGAFYTCGGYDRLKDAKCILVAEGLATAASIQKVAPPGTVVVACMSAHNMSLVAKELAQKFPQAGLGLMADNDLKTAGIDKTNPGIASAYGTANELNDMQFVPVVGRPPLTNEELEQGLSDFNDAMQSHPQETQDVVQSVVYRAVLSHDMNESAKQIAAEHKKIYDRNKQQEALKAKERIEVLNQGEDLDKKLKRTSARKQSEKKGLSM